MKTNPNYYFMPLQKNFNIYCFKYVSLMLITSITIQAVILVYNTINYCFYDIDISTTSYYTCSDICIILPLIISIYVLFTNLNIKYYELYYYVSQILIILLLMLNEIIHYISKPIIASIRFRLLVYIITIILRYIGLDFIAICYIIVFYMLTLLTNTLYKSKNKIKLISRFVVNLAIIVIF